MNNLWICEHFFVQKFRFFTKFDFWPIFWTIYEPILNIFYSDQNLNYSPKFRFLVKIWVRVNCFQIFIVHREAHEILYILEGTKNFTWNLTKIFREFLFNFSFLVVENIFLKSTITDSLSGLNNVWPPFCTKKVSAKTASLFMLVRFWAYFAKIYFKSQFFRSEILWPP